MSVGNKVSDFQTGSNISHLLVFSLFPYIVWGDNNQLGWCDYYPTLLCTKVPSKVGPKRKKVEATIILQIRNEGVKAYFLLSINEETLLSFPSPTPRGPASLPKTIWHAVIITSFVYISLIQTFPILPVWPDTTVGLVLIISSNFTPPPTTKTTYSVWHLF